MDKKIWHQKISPPGLKVSNTLLGKSGRELLMSKLDLEKTEEPEI